VDRINGLAPDVLPREFPAVTLPALVGIGLSV
jgi:hypothetical protein